MVVLPLLRSDRNGTAARVAPLAKLPVFWALDGKRALVAGGSDAAAWKAELLAACGAEVHVYALELGDVMSDLVSHGSPSANGCFVHHRYEWDAAAFADITIAIADCEDDAHAAKFFDAACRAGVPVNVIDKPVYCQFQFGSIVNRSPVIVAISTDGAAPILAQAIRRRIETLLPPSLKAWAALAHSIRDRVCETLPPGAARRAFWESFVDRAFGAAPKGETESELLAGAVLFDPPASCAIGRVTLVGAGPGDAELLTLKAVRALQAADVILFDTLVSDEVLELARREANRIPVGKTRGGNNCKPDAVNATMVALAKAGKHVVRLTSGDPMVSGGTGEQIACLQHQGISVEVVPGITFANDMRPGWQVHPPRLSQG